MLATLIGSSAHALEENIPAQRGWPPYSAKTFAIDPLALVLLAVDD